MNHLEPRMMGRIWEKIRNFARVLQKTYHFNTNLKNTTMMKKKARTLCLVLTLGASCSFAQTLQSTIPNAELFVMPKAFTAGDNVYVVSLTDENDVSVYDDDLNLVRSFKVNPQYYTTIIEDQERKAEAAVISSNAWRTIQTMDNPYEDWKGTWGEAKEWAATEAESSTGYTLEESTYENYQLWPTNEGEYYRYDLFGKRYPQVYFQWNPEDGMIWQVSASYETRYTGEWETIYRYSYDDRGIRELYFEDYDNNSHPDQGFYLSQTLFNDDEKFEYIEALMEQTETEWVGGEYDRDGDGLADRRRLSHGWSKIGYKIMSEDGTMLYSITSSADIHGIIQLNGKRYLVLQQYGESQFFRINSASSSVSEVNTLPGSAKMIFGTDGRRRQTMEKGINIVREEDGSVKKMLVK